MITVRPEFRKWATEFGEISGNLDAPLWICGIEPGGKKLPEAFCTPPEYTYSYNGQTVPCWNWLFRKDTFDKAKEWKLAQQSAQFMGKDAFDKEGECKPYVSWPFCRNSAKLAVSIVTDGKLEHWRNYYRPDTESACNDFCFGGMKGCVLCLNLYPINFSCTKKGDWTDEHRVRTGFQSNETYRSWCRGERFSRILDLISQHHPAAIICTGNSNWWREDFIDTFGIQNINQKPIKPKKLTDSHSICEMRDIGFARTRFFLIPHLSARWTNPDIQEAASWILQKLLERHSEHELSKFWPLPSAD